MRSEQFTIRNILQVSHDQSPQTPFYLSNKINKQVARFYGKRLGQLDNVLKGNVPLASFHAADVIAVQACPLGQQFLGIATLFAELPQPIAKPGLNRAWGHTSMLKA